MGVRLPPGALENRGLGKWLRWRDSGAPLGVSHKERGAAGPSATIVETFEPLAATFTAMRSAQWWAYRSVWWFEECPSLSRTPTSERVIPRVPCSRCEAQVGPCRSSADPRGSRTRAPRARGRSTTSTAVYASAYATACRSSGTSRAQRAPPSTMNHRAPRLGRHHYGCGATRVFEGFMGDGGCASSRRRCLRGCSSRGRAEERMRASATTSRDVRDARKALQGRARTPWPRAPRGAFSKRCLTAR